MLGGDLVREARRRAGLTQRELAERAGTTQSAIARLERGRTNPSFDLVLRLIRHCGFRLDVALDPYDDSDVAQAEALLRLPVEERQVRRRRARVSDPHERRRHHPRKGPAGAAGAAGPADAPLIRPAAGG